SEVLGRSLQLWCFAAIDLSRTARNWLPGYQFGQLSLFCERIAERVERTQVTHRPLEVPVRVPFVRGLMIGGLAIVFAHRLPCLLAALDEIVAAHPPDRSSARQPWRG